jgi:hypothetical protein
VRRISGRMNAVESQRTRREDQGDRLKTAR